MIEEPHQEQILVCLESNQAKMICGSSKCNQNAFVCVQKTCSNCQKKHQSCQLFRFPSILQRLKKKRKEPSQQIKKAYQALQKLYDDAIEKLSLDRDQLKDQLQMFGYYQGQIDFLKLVKDGCLKQIDGVIVSKMLTHLDQQKTFNADEGTIKLFWEKNQIKFNQIFQKLKKLPSKNKINFNSKVTDQFSLIEKFIPQPIFDIKLLYRASENKFSVSKFHTQCDNAQNTLVLARTQFDKIIGGFTDQGWGGHNQYKTDQNNVTFLFSITNQQKYVCKDFTQAIYCRNNYGPTFGSGHDFYIGDRADTNRENSYFSFGNSYNTQDSKYHNDGQAYEAFCGAKDGENNARIIQWEVFEIQFL